MQGRGGNPGESDSGLAILRPFRNDARIMLGLGGFEEDTGKTVDQKHNRWWHLSQALNVRGPFCQAKVAFLVQGKAGFLCLEEGRRTAC